MKNNIKIREIIKGNNCPGFELIINNEKISLFFDDIDFFNLEGSVNINGIKKEIMDRYGFKLALASECANVICDYIEF